MSLPAWAIPNEPPRTIILPDVSAGQLRKADDMLSMWAYENRRRDVEVADRQKADLLGRLGEQGPDALMARGYDSGMGPIALECDQLIAKLDPRKQRVLRLAYISFNSPQECALRLRVTLTGYWAEVHSARLAVAKKL